MEELGRFKLGSQLGEGPYSTVYDAEDGEQRCALRVLKEEALPRDAAQRAVLVRALAGLTNIEHPSAVRVLDAGEEAGQVFVAMEFMDCPTLEDKLASGTPMGEEQVVLFSRQIAQALDRAENVGYFHGNLKAHNVFVLSEDKVRLSGFAVKTFLEDPSTLEGYGQEEEGEGGPEDSDEWVTAEELVSARGGRVARERFEADFVGLCVLMMRMLGVEAPGPAEGESLDVYRVALLEGPYREISSPKSGVGMLTAEVVRRLLTPGGFDSPGEVVVELVSAMLLARTFGRDRGESGGFSVGTATVRLFGGLEDSLAIEAEDRPEAEARPEGQAEEAPAERLAPETGGGAYTAFYIWEDRRGGRFFVIHEGERLTIGRDPEVCDVVLRDTAVSQEHLFLSREGDVITVEDAGSRNGTFINGERVQKSELRPGDEVRVGTTRFYMSLSGPEE
ncbi:MAG: FHA domain-containing protein [Candidatus Brocadiae bacterium]|nr:FHA domain-containing protein [Candidatus Brocadiia bacterium]